MSDEMEDLQGDQELIDSFVMESLEGMAEIENDLLQIESDGVDVDTELVNRVFRAIHSIKGAAGFLSLRRIEELSHSLENVLDQIRSGHLIPTTEGVEVMLDAADTLHRMLENVADSDSVDVDILVQQLSRIESGESVSGAIEVNDECAGLTSENSDTASKSEQDSRSADQCSPGVPSCSISDLPFAVGKQVVESSLNSGQHVYVMEFDLLQDGEFGGNLVEWARRLGDTCEIIDGWVDCDAVVGVDGHEAAKLPCLMLVSSAIGPAAFEKFWQLPGTSVHTVSLAAESGRFIRRNSSRHSASSAGTDRLDEGSVSSPSTPSIELRELADTGCGDESDNQAASVEVSDTASDPPPQKTADAARPAKDSAPPSKASGSQSGEANVRVCVSVLDQLMNLAGELVLGRNQLLQTIASNDTRMLEMVATRLDQVTSELQGTIMQTRMQPVGNVFNKFTRVVRDLSKTLGKHCQLVIDGKDVELDKTIIEAIGDPLTHLVRNSVDHGVETPQVRRQNGKPETGTVHLKAYHQDGKVNISISDDGAGIDAGRLKAKAVEKGLITQERADVMSDAETLRLIFMPGFSTADQVSSVSGRGVGMDVVKTNFERLGGSVDIDTVLGKGTTMTVRLPLTLAIIPSLVVHSGNRRFALPQVNISELVRIRSGEESRRIEKLRDAEVLRLRDSLLPLIRLSSYLESDSEATPVSGTHKCTESQTDSSGESESAINIVVLEAGSLRYGLVVDGLSDSEEIVVKPLGRHMQEVKSLAGATVLGDGEIALILDVTGLAGQMGLEITETTETDTAELELENRDDSFSTLLFTNHPNEQFGVPMSCISRIERVREEQIDSVAGQEVLQYRDRTLPLLSIEDCITATPRNEQATLHVIVFHAGNREVGLIAPKILDIRDVPGELDTETFVETGVMGSIVLEGQTTRIFDPYELVREQRPSWFEEHQGVKALAGPAPATIDDDLPKILLAEDSAFFQQKVKQFLEQLGTTVITADDGAAAWETLNSGRHEFDLIVTDIEMPHVNGFELCKKIRASEQLRSLPVLALTSLASDADRERGRQAGIDEYLVKLDRDKLVIAATSHLHRVAVSERRGEVVSAN